MKVHQIKTNV